MAENTEYGIIPTYRPDEYIWIRQRLQMDLMDIGNDIVQMPTLIQQAGEYTSTAIEFREAAEFEYKKKQSEIAEYLRTQPTPKGKHRSETQILSELHLSPDLSAQQKILSEARLNAALWGNLVESLRKKDSGIRVVADLLNSGYLTKDHILSKRREEIRKVHV